MTPQNYDNPEDKSAAGQGKQGSQGSSVGPHQHGQAGGSSMDAASGAPAPLTDPASRIHATFAHEMANLLEGSLRNVSLVMASLRDVQQQRDVAVDQADHKLAADANAQAASSDAKPTPPPPSPELVLRLETADIAMRQMAQMIKQLLAGQSLASSSTSPNTAGPICNAADTFTLAQAAEHVMRLLKPIADEQGIGLELVIDNSAAGLPIGPLFPVIVNAVRNSLQAIAAYKEACDSIQASGASHDQHQHQPFDDAFKVQVNANIVDHAQSQYLQLTITDNGPGLDPVILDEHGRFRFGASTRAQGHGLGLPLARDIVKTLGGDIDITGHGRGPRSAQHDPADQNTSTFIQNHGTQLAVMVPLHRLVNLAESPNP